MDTHTGRYSDESCIQVFDIQMVTVLYFFTSDSVDELRAGLGLRDAAQVRAEHRAEKEVPHGQSIEESRPVRR